MYLNGNLIEGESAEEENITGQSETFSWQWTLNLVARNEIWLKIISKSTETYLFGTYYTQFSGYLLEEKIVLA